MLKLKTIMKRAMSMILTGAMVASSVTPAFAAESVVEDPMLGLTVLENGTNFNHDIRSLTGEILPLFANSKIEAITWADSLPEEGEKNVIKVSQADHGDIYAWYAAKEELENEANQADESTDMLLPGYPSDDSLSSLESNGMYETEEEDTETDVEYKNTVYLYSEDTVYLPQNASEMLKGLENLDDISFLDSVDFYYTENLTSFFEGDKALTDIEPLGDADMSSIKQLDKMFKDCTSLTDLSWMETYDVYSEPDENGETSFMYTAWDMPEEFTCEEFLEGTTLTEADYPQWYTEYLEEKLAKEQEALEARENEETPSDDSTTEEAAEEVPADESVTEEVPADESTAEEVPADESVTEEAPADESTAEEVPADESVTEEVPTDESVTEEVPKDESVTEEVPKDESVSEEVPKDESTTEEVGPVVGTRKSDITEEEQEEQKKEAAEATEISKAENKDKIFDAVIEKYIKENNNEELTGVGEMKLANMMKVQQSLFDANVVAEGESIDSIMTENFDTASAGWYGNYYALVPVYSFGDGDYYVSYANTMMKDADAYVQDVIFAHNNTNGEQVDGVIYDTATGLAYIPKEYYKSEEDQSKEYFMWIQAQFLQKIYSEQEDIESLVQVATEEKNNEVETEIQTDNPLNTVTTIQSKSGMNEDKLKVAVNGVELEDEEYIYDSESGQMELNVPSSSVISISIEEENPTLGESISNTISNVLGIDSAKAETFNTMASASALPQISLPSTVKVGDYWNGYSAYKYAYYGGGAAIENLQDSTYIYHIDGNDLWGDLTMLMKKIYYNTGDLGNNIVLSPRTHLNQRVNFVLSGNSYGPDSYTFYKSNGTADSSVGFPFTAYGELALCCSHIDNPLGGDYLLESVPNEDTSKWIACIAKRTMIRVLAINEDGKGQKTATIGILSASNFGGSNDTLEAKDGQSGLCVLRVNIAKDVREFKVLKTDNVTGAKLTGAKFCLYALQGTNPNSSSATWKRLGIMTEDSTGVYTFTTIADLVNNPNDYYKIKEVTAPEGYDNNDNLIEFAPFQNKSTTTKEISIKNKRNPVDIYLTKVDEKDNTIKLVDGVFKVYQYNKNTNGYNYYRTMSDTDGDGTYILENLRTTANNQGKFYVKETGNPYYVKNGQRIPYEGNYEYYFTLSAKNYKDKKLTLRTATNTAKTIKGKVEITKIDANTSENLGDGITFEVYSAINGSSSQFATKPCTTLTYNENTGKYISDPLPRITRELDADTLNYYYYNNGYYQIVETGTKDGYCIDGQKIVGVIEVVDNGDYDTVQTIRTISLNKGDTTTDDNGIVVSNKPNELNIHKKDTLERDIANVGFKIWTPVTDAKFTYNGQEVSPQTTEETAAVYQTDANGLITLTKIYPGVYYYKEVSTDMNYKLDTTTRQFTVDSKTGKISLTDETGTILNGESVESVLHNEIEQPIEITKTDTMAEYQLAENEAYAVEDTFPKGTEFTVYEWNENLTEDDSGNKYEATYYTKIVWSEVDGKFVDYKTNQTPSLIYSTTNLGKYKIVETKSSPGYILDKTPQYVVIPSEATSKSDPPLEFTFSNEPNGVSVSKLKIDGSPLPDGYSAEFNFNPSTGEASRDINVQTRYSDTEGNVAKVYRLSPGIWTYQESSVLEYNSETGKYDTTSSKYKVDDTAYKFIVNSDGTISESNRNMEVINAAQSILKIVKLDSETLAETNEESGFPSGTSFGLYEWSEELQDYKTSPSMTIVPSQDAQTLTTVNSNTQNAVNSQKELQQVTIQKEENEKDMNKIVLLDDKNSDHGNTMDETIKSINPDAECIYIPVEDENNDGNIDAQEVLDNLNKVKETNAGILLFTWTAVNSDENSAVSDKLDEIASDGIKVIVAAGNNGDKAENYVPSTAKNITVIGSANTEGKETKTTNNGERVNYYVEAENTSTAAAKYAGAYSNGSLHDLNVIKGDAIKPNTKINSELSDNYFTQNAELPYHEDINTEITDYLILGSYIYLSVNRTQKNRLDNGNYLIGRYETGDYSDDITLSTSNPDINYPGQNSPFIVFREITTQPKYPSGYPGGTTIKDYSGNARSFQYRAYLSESMVGESTRSVFLTIREASGNSGSWSEITTKDDLFAFRYLFNQKTTFHYQDANGNNVEKTVYATPGNLIPIPSASRPGYTYVWKNKSGETIQTWTESDTLKYSYPIRANLDDAYYYKSGRKFYQCVNAAYGVDLTKNRMTFVNSSNSAPAIYDVTAYYTPNKYGIRFSPGQGDTSGTMVGQQTTINSYRVQLTNGNEQISYIRFDHTIKLPANQYTRPGYHFKNWKVTGTYLNTDDYSSSLSNSATVKGLAYKGIVTLTAQWEPNTYNIRFFRAENASDYDDVKGTMIGQVLTHTSTSLYPDAATLPVVATNGFEGVLNIPYRYYLKLPANQYTRTGYTFQGWRVKAGSGGQLCSLYANEDYIISNGGTFTNLAYGGNIRFIAQWKINTYSINYELGEGASLSNKRVTYTYNKAAQTIPLNDPVRLGWTFIKWQVSYDGGNTYEDATVTNHRFTIPAGSTTNIKFKAIYEMDTASWVNEETGQVPILVETTDNKGKFMIKELTATPGYIMDETVQYVDLSTDPEEDNTYVREFSNTPNMYRIAKLGRDENNNQPRLPGIDFKFWAEEDGIESAKTYTTDSSGLITVKRLKDGVWHYQEVKNGEAFGAIYSFTVVKGVTPEYGNVSRQIHKYIYNTSYYFTVHKIDDRGKVLAGIKFLITNPSGTTTRYSTSTTGMIGVKITELGQYTIREDPDQILPEGYSLSSEVKTLTVTQGSDGYIVTNSDGTNNQDFSVIFTNLPNEVKILKKDADDGSVLPYAKFKVWSGNDESSAEEYVTDQNGEITLRNLADGTWHYKEVVAPDGYYMTSGETQTFVIENGKIDGEETSHTYECLNHKNSFYLIKTDDEENPLEGVQFRVYYKSNSNLYDKIFTTGADGKTETARGLIPGEYAYYELEDSTPEGYVSDIDIHTFTVTRDSEEQVGTREIVETVVNKPNSLKILKTDDGNNPLANVIFEFTYTGDSDKFVNESNYTENDDNVTFERVTNESGLITDEKLPSGQYLVREIINNNKTNDGKTYTIPDTVYSFTVDKFGAFTSEDPEITISDDRTTLEFKVVNTTNPTGHIQLSKLSTDGQPLEGAEFKIYEIVDEEERLLEDDEYVLRTQNGIYTFSNLQITEANKGNFIIKESGSPDGYIFAAENDKKESVTLTEKNAYSAEIIMVNTPNKVRIQKVNEDGEILPGAVFKIWKSGEENGTSEEYTTKNDGYTEYREALTTGIWYYQEIQAPPIDPTASVKKYYKLDSTIYSFQVDENGQIHAYDSESETYSEEAEETLEISAINYAPTTEYRAIQIIKHDENGDVMSEGVSFELFKQNEDTTYNENSDITMEFDEESQTFVSETINANYETDKFGIWKVVETSTKDGYVPAESFEVDLDNVSSGNEDYDYTYDEETQIGTYTRTIENHPNNLRLHKVDENNTNKAGAVFLITPDPDVKQDEGQDEPELIARQSFTTDETNEDGYVDIYGMKDGTYTVTEKKAPDGLYIDTETSYRFKVENGYMYNLTENENNTEKKISLGFKFTNHINKITIKKKDVSGNPIAGAKFLLERIENENDPTATYEDIRKEYTGELQQLDYNLVSEVPFVKLVTWSQVLESDENGYVVINSGDETLSNIPNGFYILTETEAPSPYTVIDTPYTFIMKDEGSIVNDDDTPNKNRVIEIMNGEYDVSLEIFKTDASTGKKLEGAEFTVYPFSTTKHDYDMNNPVMVIGASNWNATSKSYKATLTCNGGNEGKFIVKETKAPDNYELDPTWTGTIDGSTNNTFTFTVTNTSTGGADAWLHKIDSKTGESLDGVEFLFWKEGDEANAVTLTTGPENAPTGDYAVEGQPTNGWIHFSFGEDTLLENNTTYYYKETKALPGYSLNAAVQSFHVDESGNIDGEMVKKFTMSNHKGITLRTGGEGNTITYIMGLALLSATLIGLALYLKKKKYFR